MRKKDRFACFIQVKPYVGRYLLNNFNAPDATWSEIVNLSPDRELQSLFRSRLRKSTRYEKKYNCLSRYSMRLAIEISKDDFYRHGWSLTNTEMVTFGTIVERRIKTMLFVYLDVRLAVGAQLSTAIRDFQEKFKFNDNDWAYDTIRREYLRHSYRRMLSREEGDIRQIIDKIIIEKLSNFGTISQQGKNQYEQRDF